MFRYLLIPLRYTFIILTILIYLQKVIVKLLTNIANILIYILQRKKKKEKKIRIINHCSLQRINKYKQRIII